MEKPWLAEYPVSIDFAKTLIRKQFPEIEIKELKPLGEGFDNTVLQLNGEYVFRFPRRPIAVPLIVVENQLLPVISELLPLSIPEPVFFGKETAEYPYPFTGYRMVQGHLPFEETMESKRVSAARLAGFLKKLHGISPEKAEALGVRPDTMRRLDIPFRKPKLRENAKNLILLGYKEEGQSVLDFIEEIEPLTPSYKLALVHGDIHIRNVLLDEKGILKGIIDWGDVHLGNPAIDFSFLYSYFPKEARQAFFDVYGKIDKQTETLARFRAVYMLVTLFVYAADRKDLRLIRLTRDGLKLAMQD